MRTAHENYRRGAAKFLTLRKTGREVKSAREA